MNYADYIEQYNLGDHAGLVRKFYTDDIVFESGALKRICRGQDEVIEFLIGMQDGVCEIIRPQVVLQDQDHIFAEADMDFHALRDMPSYPLGALRNGEYLTVKVFVLYFLREGKICRVKTALWPANFGVSNPSAMGFVPAPPAR
jgi:hypothetical protein